MLFSQYSEGRHKLKTLAYLNAMYTHPTITLFVEDLWGEGDAVGWLLVLRDVLPHPHAVVLIARDVQWSVVNFKSLQEANHILLLLLDLRGREILPDCTVYEEKPGIFNLRMAAAAFCGLEYQLTLFKWQHGFTSDALHSAPFPSSPTK